MRNTIFFLAVVLLSTISVKNFAAFEKLEGNSNTKFGNYSITPSTQMVVVNDVAYKTWNLTYSTTGKSYVIFYAPSTNGQCCITVRNDQFEIQYVKKENSFGVRLVDPSLRTIKKKAIMDQIDQNNFSSQLTITTNEKTEEEYLGLVACFMPLLFG